MAIPTLRQDPEGRCSPAPGPKEHKAENADPRLRSACHPPVANRFQPPEPQSINHIIRQHARSRLFVHPIRWTSAQLQLLCCSFVFKPPKPKPKPSEASQRAEDQTARNDQGSRKPMKPSTLEIIRETVHSLLRPHEASSGAWAIGDLLDEYNIPRWFQQVDITRYPRIITDHECC